MFKWYAYKITLINALIKAVEVVFERNLTASKLEGQQRKSFTPTAPSSLVYFYISSIIIKPRALIL